MKTPKLSDRRQFLRQSGLAASIVLLPIPNFSRSTSKKHSYKMGLQLFTIRDAMEKDPLGSLKKVRELGYEDLEIYGYNGKKDTYYGFKTSEFKYILEDIGLTTSSGHYDLPSFFNLPDDELFRYVDQCIAGAHTLKQDFITWPWLDPKFRNIDGFKRLADRLNLIGERVNKGGLGFAYHNHGFEFEEHHGQIGYDIILKETDSNLVRLQLDWYWIMHSSKKEPAEWIGMDPERFVMWHIKDMDKLTRDYSELGNGSIDYSKILPKASQKGLQFYYLEQGGNFEQNSMQSISDSATYFKRHLQKFL